jgi:hypothetical protein
MTSATTGWPPGLLQDDSKALSTWLANKPHARLIVRENIMKNISATLVTNWVGIDVRTKDANKLLAQLKKLKSTKDFTGPYAYHEDGSYAQIRIQTTMTEDQVDLWLYSTKHGADYIGTFDANPPNNKQSEAMSEVIDDSSD